MKKGALNSQKGVTLVEVLASVVLMGIVAILIFNIHAESQDQYNRQSSKSQQLREISYVLKVITKDIRKNAFIITDDETKENTESGKTIYTAFEVGEHEYRFDKQRQKITLDGSDFALNIQNFYIQETITDQWFIYIENTNGKKVNTTIVER